MKRLLLAVVLLCGCDTKTTNSQKGDSMLSPQDVNALILDRLSQQDFKEIDGVLYYGKGADRGGTRMFVSTMTRDEVVAALNAVIEPHVTELAWGDDYGQYHGAFTVKGTSDQVFGLGVSSLKAKTDTFRNAPDILRDYETDIVYTPPATVKP